MIEGIIHSREYPLVYQEPFRSGPFLWPIGLRCFAFPSLLLMPEFLCQYRSNKTFPVSLVENHLVVMVLLMKVPNGKVAFMGKDSWLVKAFLEEGVLMMIILIKDSIEVVLVVEWSTGARADYPSWQWCTFWLWTPWCWTANQYLQQQVHESNVAQKVQVEAIND